jgi:hypothetical protein
LRRLLEKVGTLSACQPLVKPGILLYHSSVPKQQPTWEIAIDKSTKGANVKVGDKVTVYYSMTATEIETKPAKTPKADKKTDK